MCGIVAYIGKQEAYPILIKGLKRLEYRGYDSAGISLVNSELKVFKCKGKVADLEAFVEGKDIHCNPLPEVLVSVDKVYLKTHDVVQNMSSKTCFVQTFVFNSIL